jgi:GTP cyclohydrolase FolE2
MFRSWQMSIDLDSLRQQQGVNVSRNVTVMADVLAGT